MAMEGLIVLVCAGSLLAANPPPSSPSDDRESALAATLAVQSAMQQARDLLLHHQAGQAVETLEAQLARINGNPTYLALLRDAYRAHVQALRLAGQAQRAEVYARRLQILDPSLAAATVTEGSKGTAASGAVFRGKQEDDPFSQIPRDAALRSADILAQAEREFGLKHFRQADTYYEQAHQADPHATDPSRERWAYCKMHMVVEELNKQSSDYPALENKVRSALGLKVGKPLENFGNQLLAEIETRRTRSAYRGQGPERPARVAIRDLGRTADGWCVVETANFRIYHNLSAEWVERTAEIAERTRSEMERKWFGPGEEPWNPKCELYLHATGDDYSRATGVAPTSPGHSSFQIDGGRVLGRRIDLHVDDPGILNGVLPHETTHVVLAGRFGDHPLPRWADEGMAVLTEPRDKIDRHLRNLPRHREAGELFSLRQLINMSDYPAPQYIGAFYAESVSVVDFLSKERGPQEFVQFVRDGMRHGYDASLQQHYGYRSFDALEQRWQAYAFGTSNRTEGIAQRPH